MAALLECVQPSIELGGASPVASPDPSRNGAECFALSVSQRYEYRVVSYTYSSPNTYIVPVEVLRDVAIAWCDSRFFMSGRFAKQCQKHRFIGRKILSATFHALGGTVASFF